MIKKLGNGLFRATDNSRFIGLVALLMAFGLAMVALAASTAKASYDTPYTYFGMTTTYSNPHPGITQIEMTVGYDVPDNSNGWTIGGWAMGDGYPCNGADTSQKIHQSKIEDHNGFKNAKFTIQWKGDSDIVHLCIWEQGGANRSGDWFPSYGYTPFVYPKKWVGNEQVDTVHPNDQIARGFGAYRGSRSLLFKNDSKYDESNPAPTGWEVVGADTVAPYVYGFDMADVYWLGAQDGDIYSAEEYDRTGIASIGLYQGLCDTGNAITHLAYVASGLAKSMEQIHVVEAKDLPDGDYCLWAIDGAGNKSQQDLTVSWPDWV